MKDSNGIVVLVNSDNTDFKDEVVNSIATVYNWTKFYPFVPKKISAVAESITDKYIGTYRFENSDQGPAIVKENGALFLVSPGSPIKWKMYFTSEKEFFMLEAKWANQQFPVDENKNVTGFYILGDNYKALVSKVIIHLPGRPPEDVAEKAIMYPTGRIVSDCLSRLR